MLAQVHSFVLRGIEPIACEVEVDVKDTGFEGTTVVGLPDAAVKESSERVKSAIANAGFTVPAGRLLFNLAPADVRKEGPVYDLPLAVGLLLANQTIRSRAHRRLMFAGELALDGALRPIKGVINMAILARRCREAGADIAGVVVPAANAAEAVAVSGIEVYPAATLAQIVAHLNEQHPIEPMPPDDHGEELELGQAAVDFRDVRGQEAVKRAMGVAAAGAHNILMIGPAGTGKSMMAKALPGILPPLSRDEALEVTRVYSCVGLVPKGQSLVTRRPVRSPHHTASAAAVIGGGMIPRPGEVSLAHHGVLFLDEMPEFPRDVLETMRQPLEDGHVTIARAQGTVTFPARFQLVAAMNPTPKGDMPDKNDAYSQRQMDRYLSRLSGPLLDRIDIHTEAPAVSYRELTGPPRGTDSATLRQAVIAARRRQTQRHGSSLKPNSALSGRELDQWAPMSEGAKHVLKEAMTGLGLSARAYDKVRRVARTLADLEEADTLEEHHVAEAVQYRQLDRKL